MRWTLKPKPDAELVNQLASDIQVDPLIAALLVQRGVHSYEQAKTFFRPELSQLHDPFLMKDMDKAVARIQRAIASNENILVYGDYDVDGTTAVALMASYLRSNYPNVATYIPDRYGEGYGISYTGIDYAYDNGISLIIALDCGIKAIDKIAYASKKNIDFIICDHHRPGEQLPLAHAVLDPKRKDCSYPYDELCGCGVGFKLIQALSQANEEDQEDLLPYLDLVATAIAADIVPITGENRVLCAQGIQRINTNPRAGINAMLKSAKKMGNINVTDLVFALAPRINAAGRIKHGLHAVDLLLETDQEKAEVLASEINSFNEQRKGLDKTTTEEVLQYIREHGEENRKTTVVYNDSWHKGVLGIVASRVIETYYRPTLIFTRSGDKLAASARSVKGFDVYDALSQCSEHIEQFGGHKYAAGLTMLPEQFDAFKSKFEKVVSDRIDPQLMIPEIQVDARMSMDVISPKFYRIIKQFQPFGPGNSAPSFMVNDLYDTGYARGVGEDSKHLKMTVYQPGSNAINAIGFNLGSKLEMVKHKSPFSAVFSVEENEWNGRVDLQLKVKDIRADN
ncbi:MAG: single-stranded-DNA-specific exonuclease RecJ [Eudoraea sp.]|nr:single-stranded-DNA-specific exonuclease RecJ [Eudoraea sp.]